MVLDYFPGTMVIMVAGAFLLATVVHAAIKLVLAIIKVINMRRALKDFDGLPPHWLYGNTHQIRQHDNFLDLLMENVRKFSKCCPFWLGPFIMNMWLYHPDCIQAMYKAAEPKYQLFYKYFKPWLGEGLFTSEGKKWTRARKLLTPAFHFDVLKPYIKVFGDSTNIMMEKWKSRLRQNGAESGSFEMFDDFSLMTLDIILKCAFSYDGDVQSERESTPYIKAVCEMTGLLLKRIRFFPYSNDWIYYFSYQGYRFRKACGIAHALSQHVIDRRRKTGIEQHDADNEPKRHLDFLDALLAAKDSDGNGLTDEAIQNEVDTFMFGGHDTTTSGMSWILYNLAVHQEYQDLCRQEINTVLGDRDMFTWEDLSNLPMLTMCIKESLRLCPPVLTSARHLTKPLVLPDNRTIPKDSCVMANIYGVHHNPEVWEDPEKFDPYRFSPENSKDRPPHAFIPFSAGSRNCIGQNFAMSEMRTAVGLILRNFILKVDESKTVTKQAELILRAKDGIWLLVSPVPR